MKNRLLPFLVISALICVFPAKAQEKQVAGWVEKVRIYPGNLALDAKLDTGAVTCSLHAAAVKEFRKEGEKWVRFEVVNDRGEKVTLERKLLRHVAIKRHFFKSQRRPVISLGICLGNIYREAEVNLVDRSGFQYRMLIGRNFLEGRVRIDPALQHQLEPRCRQPNLE
jgi:hypothetical protein